MRKFLLISGIVLAVLAAVMVIAFSAFVIKWNQCAKTKSVPEVTETVFPSKKVELGEKVPCTFKVKTSWSLMPVSANITASEGLQEGKSSVITAGKWMWGYRMWNVTVWVQPYRDGDYPGTQVRILCEGGPDGKAVLDAKIPAFKVELAEDTDGKLELADQVSQKKEEKKRTWVWYLCGAGVLLLGGALWLILFLKKRSKETQIPAWVAALNDIDDLRASLYEKMISPENAVTKLTYILRCYLEERFSLRAERQTTAEFLESLRRDNSPLDVEQRRFLREFLTSADMVKFARLSTDEESFDEAAGRAESLIRTTSLTIEFKENKS